MKIYILFDERKKGSDSVIEVYKDELLAHVSEILHSEYESSFCNNFNKCFKVKEFEIKDE